VNLLTRFLGVFYEADLVVAKVIERKSTTDLKVKGRGSQRYPGKVIVLVDAGSASASELFARTMQLTGRGVVLGDRSAGAVRVSRFFGHHSGTQNAAFYGASVTIADIRMSDGAGLEGTGVVPDELILPTGEQMARREDPVLARALALAGVDWTPERAGRSW
jgi:carboxyl-terminal processing protease